MIFLNNFSIFVFDTNKKLSRSKCFFLQSSMARLIRFSLVQKNKSFDLGLIKRLWTSWTCKPPRKVLALGHLANNSPVQEEFDFVRILELDFCLTHNLDPFWTILNFNLDGRLKKKWRIKTVLPNHGSGDYKCSPQKSNIISVARKFAQKSSQILEKPKRPTSKYFWKPKISTWKLFQIAKIFTSSTKGKIQSRFKLV